MVKWWVGSEQRLRYYSASLTIPRVGASRSQRCLSVNILAHEYAMS